VAPIRSRGCHWGMVERRPLEVVRDVMALTFRGSRSELERLTALRLQAAFVLIFLAGRGVHLGQAGVDLALAGGAYTHEGLALGLMVACVAESVLFAAVSLHARRLRRRVLLADAVFGIMGLALMSAATSATPGRGGSLNWMLPYSVATAAGLGLVAGGDLVATPGAGLGAVGSRRPGRRRDTGQHLRVGSLGGLWPLGVAVALGGVYVASVYLPHRLAGDHPAQIWGNAANYPVFFVGAMLAAVVLRRRLTLISSRNAEVTVAAAQLAHAAQWRAVAVDVFGPVVDLLDRVVGLDDGEVPTSVRVEADWLISMIEAVRPMESKFLSEPGSSAALGRNPRC